MRMGELELARKRQLLGFSVAHHYAGVAPMIRWWLACTAALFACAQPSPLPPPGSDSCVLSCEHRKAIGCLEKAFEGRCAEVCHYASEAGLFDPLCSLRTDLEGQKFCGVRCGR